MRVLGTLGIAVACVGGWMVSEASAHRGGASKALGNHYDFYATDGSWQYTGPGGTFRTSTSGMGLADDAGVFHLAGHRHHGGWGDGCGCGGRSYGYRGGYAYRPWSYGYRGGMYGYYGDDDYYGGQYYGYQAEPYGRRAYRQYGMEGYGTQQYGYRPGPQPGDEVVVVAPGAELMRGYDAVGFVEQGQRLPVLQVAGPWIGTAIERGDRRIGGWILRDAIAPVDAGLEGQQRGYDERMAPRGDLRGGAGLEPIPQRDLERQQQDLQREGQQFRQDAGREGQQFQQDQSRQQQDIEPQQPDMRLPEDEARDLQQGQPPRPAGEQPQGSQPY